MIDGSETIESLRQQLSVAASEILALRAANKECVEYFNEVKKDLAEKDAEIERRLAASDGRYMELHNAARRCVRYDGVDPAKFNEAMRHMDALIQRHIAGVDAEVL